MCNDRIFTIFDKSNNNKQMKSLKVSEIIKMLEKDGWYLKAQKGSHRQFKHPEKKGKVTVNGKSSDTLSQELLNSIFKQAGWKLAPQKINNKNGKSKSISRLVRK